MLPYRLACRASALLVCHDPFPCISISYLKFQIRSMTGRRGAAPRTLSFGDSTAQAGARPVPKSKIANLKSKMKNGAVAGSCTWTSSVAGRHSAVKSQPRKVKGRERHCTPGPPFQ